MSPLAEVCCSILVIFTFRLLSLEEFHSRKTLESAAWAAEQGPSAPEPKTIYDIEVKNAQGETVPLSVSSLSFARSSNDQLCYI